MYLADFAQDIDILLGESLNDGGAADILLRQGNASNGVIGLLNVVGNSAARRQGVNGSQGSGVLVTRPWVRSTLLY